MSGSHLYNKIYNTFIMYKTRDCNLFFFSHVTLFYFYVPFFLIKQVFLLFLRLGFVRCQSFCHLWQCKTATFQIHGTKSVVQKIWYSLNGKIKFKQLYLVHYWGLIYIHNGIFSIYKNIISRNSFKCEKKTHTREWIILSSLERIIYTSVITVVRLGWNIWHFLDFLSLRQLCFYCEGRYISIQKENKSNNTKEVFKKAILCNVWFKMKIVKEICLVNKSFGDKMLLWI